MNLDRVRAGNDVPNDCNVIIEIPMHGDPIKYEVDKETGAVFVDRFMSTAMHYPCNYGYIPNTLSGRRRSVRRAGALAGAADHRRGRALPSDRHAQDGRRSRRRRQDPGRADRQADGTLSGDPFAATICRRSARGRSPISSSITRISSPANGFASRAGSAPTKPRRRSWPASRVTRRRSRSRASRQTLPILSARARRRLRPRVAVRR